MGVGFVKDVIRKFVVKRKGLERLWMRERVGVVVKVKGLKMLSGIDKW